MLLTSLVVDDDSLQETASLSSKVLSEGDLESSCDLTITSASLRGSTGAHECGNQTNFSGPQHDIALGLSLLTDAPAFMPIISENFEGRQIDDAPCHVDSGPSNRGEFDWSGESDSYTSLANIYAPNVTQFMKVSSQLYTESPQPGNHDIECNKCLSSNLPKIQLSQNFMPALGNTWEYMTAGEATKAQEIEKTSWTKLTTIEGENNLSEVIKSTQSNDRPPKHSGSSASSANVDEAECEERGAEHREGELLELRGAWSPKNAHIDQPQNREEGASPTFSTLLLQRDQNSLANEAFKIAETEQEPLSQHNITSRHLQQTSVASSNPAPEETNETQCPGTFDTLLSEIFQITGRLTQDEENIENVLDDKKSALRGFTSIQERLSSAAGELLGTQASGMVQATSEKPSVAPSALHIWEGGNVKSAVSDLVKTEGATFGSLPFNTISQVTLDQTGLGKAIATATDVIAVAEAVKNNDAAAILEDEHVQELGKKALGAGLQFATSAMLTASGAGAVLAVASAASDVIAATKETENIRENGKYGLSGFVLESGAKIALKAAIKGSGVGAALEIAAPILDPLCQEAVSEIAKHGVQFMDQAASSLGVENAFNDRSNAVVLLEESASSSAQSKGQTIVTPATLQPGEQAPEIVNSIAAAGGNSQNEVVLHQEGVDKSMLTIKSKSLMDERTDAIVNARHSSVNVMEAPLPASSIYMDVQLWGSVTNPISSESPNGVTITMVSSTMDMINARFADRFEPIRAGLELLEALSSMSDGLYPVNGLSATAITKVYKVMKSEILNDAGKRRTLFDPDGDGVVHYNDTVRALAFLGLKGLAVRFAAYNFHVMFSYPTSGGWFPRFKTSLPIRIKNMNGTAQGRNWGTLNRARLIGKSYVKEFLSGDMWLMGSRALRTFLFLFEWGTMWPFHIPSDEPSEDFRPEEISQVLTSAILPLVLNHWALFRNIKQ